MGVALVLHDASLFVTNLSQMSIVVPGRRGHLEPGSCTKTVHLPCTLTERDLGIRRIY